MKLVRLSSVQSNKAYRALIWLGFGLLLLGFAGMNFRPYAYGDTRIFGWMAINGIITMAGVVVLVVTALVAILRMKTGGKAR